MVAGGRVDATRLPDHFERIRAGLSRNPGVRADALEEELRELVGRVARA